MHPLLASLAFALSLTPLAPGFAAEGPAARTAIAALVWTVLAGLPRSARPVGLRWRLRELAPVLALALPALALAARLDAAAGPAANGANGAPGAGIAATAAFGAALLVLAALGAGLASRHARAAAIYGGGWLALVAGPPLMAATAELGRGAPAWLWSLARGTSAPAQLHALAAGEAAPGPIAPLAVALALVLAPGFAARGEGN